MNNACTLYRLKYSYEYAWKWAKRKISVRYDSRALKTVAMAGISPHLNVPDHAREDRPPPKWTWKMEHRQFPVLARRITNIAWDVRFTALKRGALFHFQGTEVILRENSLKGSNNDLRNVAFDSGLSSKVKVTREPYLRSFISEGAKFYYDPTSLTLTAKGPILAPISLLVYRSEVPAENSNFRLDLNFTVSRQNDPQFSVQQNEWILHGWSKCSADCDGGTQHILLKWVQNYTLISLFTGTQGLSLNIFSVYDLLQFAFFAFSESHLALG